MIKKTDKGKNLGEFVLFIKQSIIFSWGLTNNDENSLSFSNSLFLPFCLIEYMDREEL